MPELMDPFAQFKQSQKEGWKHFAAMEALTTASAARLVHFAGVDQGMRVLDIACGTGVVAVTAARLGASVKGADLTPQLLERARENARIADVEIEWVEADVEQLPFEDGQFQVVLSQFGHMFAPRPEVAVAEMLRVLRPGGTIAHSTWPAESLSGRAMALQARYAPPQAHGATPPSPMLWGDPNVVRQRLGHAVEDIVFDREQLLTPTLSPQHFRLDRERSAGPIIKMVEYLSATNPDQLRAFRQEYDALVSQYLRDNLVRSDYLITRARKRQM